MVLCSEGKGSLGFILICFVLDLLLGFSVGNCNGFLRYGIIVFIGLFLLSNVYIEVQE